MKKSVTTRIRITKKGKVLTRKMAQCHFRAKKTGKQITRKSRGIVMHEGIARKIFKKQGEF